MQTKAMHIKAVVFHLEGTLIEPYKHDAITIKAPNPVPDAEAVFGYLRSKDIRLAIVSHGSLASVQKMLANLSYLSVSDFDTIISREELSAHQPGYQCGGVGGEKNETAGAPRYGRDS